jgi:hypothetical protein
MADGGWIYDKYNWIGATKADLTLQGWWNAIKGLLEGMSGWSNATALTSYLGSASAQAYYAVSSHSGGARVVWIFSAATTGTLVHASNMDDGATEITSGSNDPMLYMAYLPSDVAALGVGDPTTDSWLPSGSLKFTKISTEEFDEQYNGANNAWVHLMVRGDDVILGIEQNAQALRQVDQIHLFGDVFAQLPTSGDTDTQGILSWPSSTIFTLNNSSTSFQMRDGSGGTIWGRATSTGVVDISWNSDLLSNNVVDTAPWNWVSPVIHVEDPDLTTNGITPGQGVKGIINPEMFRMCNSAIALKQRLASGNYVHLRNGFVVGYDSTNPAMS